MADRPEALCLPVLTAGQEAAIAALLAADLEASASDSHEWAGSHAGSARGRPDGRGLFEDYQCTEENRGRRDRPGRPFRRGRCGRWSVRGDTRCASHGGWPGRLEWEESGRGRVEEWLAACAALGQAPMVLGQEPR